MYPSVGQFCDGDGGGGGGAGGGGGRCGLVVRVRWMGERDGGVCVCSGSGGDVLGIHGIAQG